MPEELASVSRSERAGERPGQPLRAPRCRPAVRGHVTLAPIQYRRLPRASPARAEATSAPRVDASSSAPRRRDLNRSSGRQPIFLPDPRVAPRDISGPRYSERSANAGLSSRRARCEGSAVVPTWFQFPEQVCWSRPRAVHHRVYEHTSSNRCRGGVDAGRAEALGLRTVAPRPNPTVSLGRYRRFREEAIARMNEQLEHGATGRG